MHPSWMHQPVKIGTGGGGNHHLNLVIYLCCRVGHARPVRGGERDIMLQCEASRRCWPCQGDRICIGAHDQNLQFWIQHRKRGIGACNAVGWITDHHPIDAPIGQGEVGENQAKVGGPREREGVFLPLIFKRFCSRSTYQECNRGAYCGDLIRGLTGYAGGCHQGRVGRGVTWIGDFARRIGLALSPYAIGITQFAAITETIAIRVLGCQGGSPCQTCILEVRSKRFERRA